MNMNFAPAYSRISFNDTHEKRLTEYAKQHAYAHDRTDTRSAVTIIYDVYYIIRLYMQSDTFTTNLKVPRKVVV